MGYLYAHDYPDHYAAQQYLPDEMSDAVFYRPAESGYEKNIREYLHKVAEWKKDGRHS